MRWRKRKRRRLVLEDYADRIGYERVISFQTRLPSGAPIYHTNAKDCLPFEGFNQLFDRYGSLARQKVVPLGKQSLHTLKDYLMANLDQTVRLDALSELCQLSPTQFQRHFKGA